VAELVQKYVFAPLVVAGKGAEQVVDAPAAIPFVIDHDVEHVVGHGLGDIPHGAVVLGQHITLGAQ